MSRCFRARSRCINVTASSSSMEPTIPRLTTTLSVCNRLDSINGALDHHNNPNTKTRRSASWWSTSVLSRNTSILRRIRAQRVTVIGHSNGTYPVSARIYGETSPNAHCIKFRYYSLRGTLQNDRSLSIFRRERLRSKHPERPTIDDHLTADFVSLDIDGLETYSETDAEYISAAQRVLEEQTRGMLLCRVFIFRFHSVSNFVHFPNISTAEHGVALLLL